MPNKMYNITALSADISQVVLVTLQFSAVPLEPFCSFCARRCMQEYVLLSTLWCNKLTKSTQSQEKVYCPPIFLTAASPLSPYTVCSICLITSYPGAVINNSRPFNATMEKFCCTMCAFL